MWSVDAHLPFILVFFHSRRFDFRVVANHLKCTRAEDVNFIMDCRNEGRIGVEADGDKGMFVSLFPPAADYHQTNALLHLRWLVPILMSGTNHQV